MQTIALLSNKGGAGKTTVAINLAVAASIAGYSSVLVDTDPQSSSSQWADSRETDEPVVVSTQPSRLEKVLETANKAEADYCFIDTAPHSETGALKAARAADFCLIPIRPTILDIRAVGLTLEMLELVRKPSALVINAIPTKGLSIDAENALSEVNVELCPIKLWQRVAYMHSLTGGLGVMEYEKTGKAANEINRLFQWLNIHV